MNSQLIHTFLEKTIACIRSNNPEEILELQNKLSTNFQSPLFLIYGIREYISYSFVNLTSENQFIILAFCKTIAKENISIEMVEIYLRILIETYNSFFENKKLSEKISENCSEIFQIFKFPIEKKLFIFESIVSEYLEINGNNKKNSIRLKMLIFVLKSGCFVEHVDKLFLFIRENIISSYFDLKEEQYYLEFLSELSNQISKIKENILKEKIEFILQIFHQNIFDYLLTKKVLDLKVCRIWKSLFTILYQIFELFKIKPFNEILPFLNQKEEVLNGKIFQIYSSLLIFEYLRTDFLKIDPQIHLLSLKIIKEILKPKEIFQNLSKIYQNLIFNLFEVSYVYQNSSNNFLNLINDQIDECLSLIFSKIKSSESCVFSSYLTCQLKFEFTVFKFLCLNKFFSPLKKKKLLEYFSDLLIKNKNEICAKKLLILVKKNVEYLSEFSLNIYKNIIKRIIECNLLETINEFDFSKNSCKVLLIILKNEKNQYFFDQIISEFVEQFATFLPLKNYSTSNFIFELIW